MRTSKELGSSGRRASLVVAVFVLVGGVVGAAGCAHKQSSEDGEIRHRKKSWTGEVPAFEARVPADTPYVYSTRGAVDLRTLAKYFDFQLEIDEENLRESEDESDRRTAPLVRLYQSLSGEFRGDRPAEAYEAIGVGPEAEFGCYGLELMPVCRLSIEDRRTFVRWFEERGAEIGLEMEWRALDGRPYRSYRVTGSAQFWVAVTDSEFIFGLARSEAMEQYVAYGLGVEAPERSLADAGHFDGLVESYRPSDFGGGYVDAERLAALRWPEAAGVGGETPGGRLAVQWAEQKGDEETASKVCQQEWLKLGSQVGRGTVAVQSLSDEKFRMTFGMESDASLVRALREAHAPIPGWGRDWVNQSVMSVGLGFDVDKVVQVARALGRTSGYRCGQLSWLNGWKTRAARLAGGLPDGVRTLDGLHAVMTSFAGGFNPRGIQELGVMTLAETPEPDALLKFMSMVIPGWKQAELPERGKVVEMPAPFTYPGIEGYFVGKGKDRVGAATRASLQDSLRTRVSQSPPRESTPYAGVIFGEKFTSLFKWIVGDDGESEASGAEQSSGGRQLQGREANRGGAGSNGGARPDDGADDDDKVFSFELRTELLGSLSNIQVLAMNKGFAAVFTGRH